MRLIETVHAAGHVLCHDITVIVKDVKKGVAFKKGHVVTQEDIPELLKLGKDHLYVWENDGTLYHEDEAAAILRDLCMGKNIRAGQPSAVSYTHLDVYKRQFPCSRPRRRGALTGAPKWEPEGCRHPARRADARTRVPPYTDPAWRRNRWIQTEG